MTVPSDTSAVHARPAAVARVVLITGAARRIGRALALGFASRGWDVAVHYGKSKAEADEMVAEIVTWPGPPASTWPNAGSLKKAHASIS